MPTGCLKAPGVGGACLIPEARLWALVIVIAVAAGKLIR